MKKTLLTSAALMPLALFAARPASMPNIIYILADDMGYGDVSALDGNTKLITPNLNNMINMGMHFTDAHTSSSVSTPSRYSILTGRYNWRSELQSGVTWSYSAPIIPKERTTVATMLSEAGYNTAVIGKWHLGLGWERNSDKEDDIRFTNINFSPNDNGFDYSFIMSASLDIPPYTFMENHNFTAPIADTVNATEGFGFYRKGPRAADFDINTALERFTTEALGYIDEKSKEDKPFFLYFPLTAPHTPILPPKEFQGKSGLNPYADFVLYVDDIVGRIMAEVEKNGIENNTIIIFTTDNGCSPMADIPELKAKGHSPNSIYRGHKADVFDGGHRIPFIVKWPKEVKQGSVCNRPISLTSFMATCADINGITLPQNAAEDSHSIYSDLKGKKTSSEIIIQHSIDGYFTIRSGRWKLCACPHSGGWSYPTPNRASADLPPMQLFDMETNPTEDSSKNLYYEHPEIVKELTAELEKAVNNGATRKGVIGKNDVEVNIYKK